MKERTSELRQVGTDHVSEGLPNRAKVYLTGSIFPLGRAILRDQAPGLTRYCFHGYICSVTWHGIPDPV